MAPSETSRPVLGRLALGRLALAGVAGLAVTAVTAVVLGDYPLTGAVPWVAPVLVPMLIGVVMTLTAGGYRRWVWMATGPLAAASVLWGVRIATGWGLDPWPASWWGIAAVALVWPPAWGVLSTRREPGRSPASSN